MRQGINWLLAIPSEDEDQRTRGSTVALIALGLVAASVVLLFLVLVTQSAPGLIIVPLAILGFLSAFLCARLGYVNAGAIVLIALVLAAVFSSVLISQRLSFALFYLSLSVFIASLTLRPRYVWLVFVANLLGFAIMFGTIPINTSEPATRELLVGSVTLLGIVTIISFLGSSILARATGRLRVAYLQLEDNAALLARANVDLEAQVAARTVDLQAALQEVRSRADEQERLLAETHQQRAVIREMSVPIIPVSDTVVVIPLVGALDSARLMELQTRTLHAVEQSRVHQLVLDITGVVVVDSQVAQGIIDVVQSARLLGAEVILVGIRPEVAQSIVQLGLQLAGMRTFSTLYAALNAIKSN